MIGTGGRHHFGMRGRLASESAFANAHQSWPKPGDAVMALTKLQFQALFAGLDWRRIEAPKTCLPRAAE